MPGFTIKILDSQREALYEQVRNHLAAVGDLWLALESTHDYAAAERLAIEFGEDFRLMADLGWQPEDDREFVELTMAPEDLTEVIRRLRDEARGGLGDREGERGSIKVFTRQTVAFEAAEAACEDILSVLAERYGGEADGCRR